MPTSADARPDLVVDTSVAVALVTADHVHHELAVDRLGERRLGLAGHAAFELHSVLTRLPPPRRLSSADVTRLVERHFPGPCFLGPGAQAQLLGRLGELGIAGGAVYDALVGAAALEHGLALATSDRRALATYQALGVQVELLTAQPDALRVRW